jgi:transposase-like protein
MRKIDRFIIWICSKFTRAEIEAIIAGLLEVLANRNPDVKPRDDFKEKHPHYRNFSVDPLPPLTKPPQKESTPDWKTLLKQYLKEHGKPLRPVSRRSKKLRVPEHIRCLHCNAPSKYLYYNDGKRRSQILCKLCGNLSQISKRKHHSNTPFFCPYCHHALFLWKHKELWTSYKCGNNRCPRYLENLDKLNPREKKERKKRSSQFKLRYQYRVYHFKDQELSVASPLTPTVDLSRIHHHPSLVGLILTFHISFALSARKTALILKQVFNVVISHQTVLNYAEAAAFWCHRFNHHFKGSIDAIAAGDETHIKVKGNWAYTFLFIAVRSLKIIAYHVAHDRSVLPAVCALKEAIRTARENQTILAITDDNPSYAAGVHFINSHSDGTPLEHHKVIALQDLDQESETYRPFKQIVERLNRTYKFHTRSACGFDSFYGAVILTTLFVTHYNFLRPHSTLRYNTPIIIDELHHIPTIQDRWCKIIDMAMDLAA